MMNDRLTFADYVRKYCTDNEIPPTTLAKRLEISRGTFYALLEPDSEPKLNHIIALSHIIKVNPCFLLRLKYQEFDFAKFSIEESKLSSIATKTPTDQSLKTTQAVDVGGFVDETLPDGSIVMAGNVFEKSWTIQNLGEVVWEDRVLACLDELCLGYFDKQDARCCIIPMQSTIDIPKTYPNQTVTISATLIAPNLPGRYISYWKMKDKKGNSCFPDGFGLSLSIKVCALGVNSW